MQNLLGYGGESYVKNGVIKHYVGAARLSWVDCEDVGSVAALGYEAKTYYEVAQAFTEALEQPFSYEPQ